MSLVEYRDFFKPFEYPWAFEYFQKQQQMHWVPTEVPMAEDVSDWKFKLTKEEKNLVTQILRFFTQGDVDISRGYIENFLPVFKPPEIRMMMSAFASMEGVHIHAYSYLIDTLGLPETEYKLFHEYEQMQNKHKYYFNEILNVSEFDALVNKLDLITKKKDTSLPDRALDLAKFSAFGEGLQLFSSFAILMNFQRFGKLKGLGQIVTWSVRDEALHCEAMIKLFNTFIDENPYLWVDDFKKHVYQTCRDMVDLEDKFIDLAFNDGSIDGLNKDDVKKYIRYLADRRLLQMRLKPNYNVKKNPLEWFDYALLGNEHGNFFERRVTEYSKGVSRGDWSEAF